MGIQIQDGTGNGYSAQVNDDNRLRVESKARPSEEVEAALGNAFIFHGECHTSASATGGLMAFKNTSSTHEVVITRIYIDSHTITPADLIVLQEKDPTTTNGTDVSISGVIQKNFGSGKSLSGTLTISDGSSDMTFAGGKTYHSFPVSSMSQYSRNMMGTNIVTPNTAIGWSFKRVGGGDATDAEIIALSVNCFVREFGSGNGV